MKKERELKKQGKSLPKEATPPPIETKESPSQSNKKDIRNLLIAGFIILGIALALWFRKAVAISPDELNGHEFQVAKANFESYLKCVEDSLTTQITTTTDSAKITAIQTLLQHKSTVADSKFSIMTNGVDSYDSKQFTKLTEGIDSALQAMRTKLFIQYPNCRHEK